jgi:serine/threonine-protein kinase
MGETFLAERADASGIAQRVCIKTIRTSDSDDPRWVEDFRREARTIGQLRHQNIVSLVDFGEERGTWWMALGLVEGRDLRSILESTARGPAGMPMDAGLLIVIDLAKALAYAHRATDAAGAPMNVVHRDVRPENNMISFSGEVILTDSESRRPRTRSARGRATSRGSPHTCRPRTR